MRYVKIILVLAILTFVVAVAPEIRPLGFELGLGSSPAWAGFELGSSPAWSGKGVENASETAKAATEGVDPGSSASDTAVDAAGVKPNSNRQSP